MDPELELLQPALEMAVVVARQDESLPVPVPSPRAIRPFLRFTRLPPRALAGARAALDDDGFRARVAARSDEDDVGRAGWLLLTRPDGWEEEFAALVEQRELDLLAAERSGAAGPSTHEELDEARSHLADVSEQLVAARAALAASEAGVAAMSAELVDERAALAAMTDERARAVRELKAMERRLAERTAEVRQLRDAGQSPVVDADPEAVVPDAGPVDQALAEARTEWERLQPALHRLDELLAPASAALPSTLAASPRRRQPVRLGKGLTEGSAAGARWLLSRPGAVAYVDGYNVSMLAWPELSAAEQRGALERASGDMQVRTGATITLVFDGEAAGSAQRAAVGSPVRVRFTDADVEADDQILAMVDASSDSVVVVVSNDRRVQDGARSRGANVVGATEFVAVLR